MVRQARCNRVHSAVTQEVKDVDAEKLGIHAVLEKLTSGQLLFLGLMQGATSRRAVVSF